MNFIRVLAILIVAVLAAPIAFAQSYPSKPLKFFDKAASVSWQNAKFLPPAVQYPCTGCPSAGGAGAPANTSG